jgi:hypothetical protein
VTRISAHGLSAELPAGWDGEIYVRDSAATGSRALSGPNAVVERPAPVLQLADFALPAARAHFGGGALEFMGTRNLFVSLFEHGPDAVGTPLFADKGHPWPVPASAFGPNRLQRPLPGQAGAQFFFTAHQRAFCLYVVVGSYSLRGLLTRRLNHVLTTITITRP